MKKDPFPDLWIVAAPMCRDGSSTSSYIYCKWEKPPKKKSQTLLGKDQSQTAHRAHYHPELTTPLKEFRGVTTYTPKRVQRCNYTTKSVQGCNYTPKRVQRCNNTPKKVQRCKDTPKRVQGFNYTPKSVQECRAQGGGGVRSRRGSEGSTYTLVELPPVLIGTRVGSPLIFGVHADFGLDNVGTFLGPF